jgi:hypothetical protein
LIVCKNGYEEGKLKKINPQVTQEEERKTCLHVMEVKRTKKEKRHLVVCSVKLNTGVICASLMQPQLKERLTSVRTIYASIAVARDIGLDIVGVVGAITVGRNIIPVYMIRKRTKVIVQY